MNFAQIPAGASVLLDANVFVYHFGRHAVLQPACQQLLERVARGDVVGFSSSDVLSDVAHRMMTIEAAGKYGWPMTGIAYRLQRHPAELQALAQFRQAVEEIPQFGVQVLPITAGDVLAAAALSQQHGLLSGDAFNCIFHGSLGGIEPAARPALGRRAHRRRHAAAGADPPRQRRRRLRPRAVDHPVRTRLSGRPGGRPTVGDSLRESLRVSERRGHIGRFGRDQRSRFSGGGACGSPGGRFVSGWFWRPGGRVTPAVFGSGRRRPSRRGASPPKVLARWSPTPNPANRRRSGRKIWEV